MNKFFSSLTILILALFLSSCFGSVEKPMIKPNEAVLSKVMDNGFTYHLFETKNDEQDAKVSFRFLVNIGSFQEDASQKGYAHFVEHLAFRSSENFTYEQKKQYLLDGGLKFGQHSNAFTDYDKTLYFIDEVNSTDARVETDLELFKDVASGVLFDEKDVNLERNIVVQELLLRQPKEDGFEKELADLYDETGVFDDKKPIGTRGVIEAATVETLKAFYDKWYQPQFMHLVVVGDFDKQKMAQRIEAIFGELPKSSLSKTKNPQANLPTGVHFVDDTEYPNNAIYLYIPIEVDDYGLQTTDQYQQTIFNDFVIGGIDSQLHRINDANGKKFPFLSTQIKWRQGIPFATVTIRHAENQQLQALEFITDNLAKLRAEGFDRSQYKNQMGYIDQRAKNPSSSYAVDGDAVQIANQLYYDVYDQTQHIGSELESQQAAYFVSSVKQEAVKTHIQKILGQDMGMVVLSHNSVADGEQEKLTSILEAFHKNKPADTVSDEKGINATSEIAQYSGDVGSIVEQKTIENSEIKYLKLSNGMNVYLKRRTDDEGHISIKLMAKGGLEYLPAKLIPASKIALQILSTNGVGGIGQQQLLEYLNKNQIELRPYLDVIRHGIKMNVQKTEGHERAFNLLHHALIEPIVHEGQFEAAKQNFVNQVEQYYDSPEGRYLVSSIKGVYTDGGDHLLVNVDVAKAMKSDDVLAVYKHLFADMSLFNLVIVGDFKQSIIEDYLEQYIASIPTKAVALKQAIIKTTDEGFKFRSDEGEKDQSTIELNFMNKSFEKKSENQNGLYVASRIVEQRLFEELRNKQGLVYGVNVGVIQPKISATPATFRIIFAALPKNEQKSFEFIQTILDDIKLNGFGEDELRVAVDETKEAWVEFNDSNEGTADSIAKSIINDELKNDYILALQNLEKLNVETVGHIFNGFMENSVKSQLIFSNQ